MNMNTIKGSRADILLTLESAKMENERLIGLKPTIQLLDAHFMLDITIRALRSNLTNHFCIVQGNREFHFEVVE